MHLFTWKAYLNGEKSELSSVNIRAILLWMLYFRYGLLLYKSILPQPAECVHFLFSFLPSFLPADSTNPSLSFLMRRGCFNTTESMWEGGEPPDESASAAPLSSLFWLVLSHYSNSLVSGHLLKTKSRSAPPAWHRTANCWTRGR